MKVSDVLAEKGIPRADLEVLLAHVLQKDRGFLAAHPEFSLSAEQEKKIREWMARRKNHEPTAYIVGKQEFYGRTFKVDPRVLIPRPATEGLVDLALQFLKNGKNDTREIDSNIIAVAKAFGDVSDVETIVDVGTGSGCIAITLALERPDLHIIATDISEDALAVARENAALHRAADRIRFLQGKDLEPIADLREPFVIVSNPPYMPKGRSLEAEVMHEPHQALFDARMPQRLLEHAQKIPHCRGIIVECEAIYIFPS
ncbi:peptide chain release factor N(5)-glutamine methyltransferase [Candidatus Peregrinibacteria bacterium]|nr:peptide chain release factor N(5)-glutamine methyltransferase [Candidatus Peregrinibacteria bacterium]